MSAMAVEWSIPLTPDTRRVGQIARTHGLLLLDVTEDGYTVGPPLRWAAGKVPRDVAKDPFRASALIAAFAREIA